MTDIRTIAQRALDTIDHNDIRVNNAVHHALNDLRQALAEPEPSVDALIGEAVAKEREACAELCDNADKSTHPSNLAKAIRAKEQK